MYMPRYAYLFAVLATSQVAASCEVSPLRLGSTHTSVCIFPQGPIDRRPAGTACVGNLRSLTAN